LAEAFAVVARLIPTFLSTREHVLFNGFGSAMQFHIDQDIGTAIAGWCLPDNPSVVPRISISIPGKQKIEMTANVFRSDIKNLGQHSTGMVGFVVDETIVPELSFIKEIEISDSETQLVIYRRIHSVQQVERKLFRLELQVMPKIRLEEIFTSHFNLYYQSVERYPFDTLFAILNNQYARSIYVSGRPSLIRYQQLLRERGFITIAMLADPIEELAERLLFAQLVLRSKRVATNMTNYLAGLDPVIELVESINLEDSATIERALNSLTEAQEQALSNPFVRALACKIDDIPNKHHIGIALDNLATMDLVGIRHRFSDFSEILHEILGHKILGDFQLSDIAAAKSLSSHLTAIRGVRKLLEFDLALYSYVEEAFENALD
jgi:hypothetical protein